MIVLLQAVTVISGFSAAWDALSGKRWFRDITMQTPFYTVTAEPEPVDGGLAVRGKMVKRRCEYQGFGPIWFAPMVCAFLSRWMFRRKPPSGAAGRGPRPKLPKSGGRGSFPRRSLDVRRGGKSLPSTCARTVRCR